MKRLLGILGWTCQHRRYTWPVKRGEGKYTVSCLECGATLPYDWKHMRLKSPRNGQIDNLTINPKKVLDKQTAIAL